MSIPSDNWRHEIWKYMSYDELLNYCNTSRLGREVCEDPETWRFLLIRDFNQETTGSYTKEVYERFAIVYNNIIKQIDNSLKRGIDPRKQSTLLRV